MENAETEDEEEKLVLASPELIGYTKGDGEYICFDHSPLISEYKKRLSYNHARYTALRHDFEKLEAKYTDLINYAAANFTNKKKVDMENKHEQMPKHLQEEIYKLSAQYKTEKEELLARMGQINQAYKSLEDENQSLHDQANMQTASGEQKEAIVMRWKEENSILKEKVAEQQYLQDVVDEKKSQIEFLQNQLEQRIKNQHQSEQLRLQTLAELEEIKNVHTADIHQAERLKKDLLQKQEELDKLKIMLCGKEEQLNERQQLLGSKLEHITRLENNLHESKEQNEKINVLLSEAKGEINNLQEQLLSEQSKVQSAEQKLLLNKQTLQRMHKDFSSIIEEETPVIAMRPEYSHQENEEASATH